MIINKILTEWRFRLPKGYPTVDADYRVLYEVILEMTTLSPLEAQNIVSRAKGEIAPLTEQPAGVEVNDMYSGRVYRVKTANEITVYAEQPYDDHDFDLTDAAANNIPSKSITYDEFQRRLNDRSSYNVYKFNLAGKLLKTIEITGSTLIKMLNTLNDDFYDPYSFEEYIMRKFAVEGQQIIGLPGMYDAIMKHTDSEDLIRLITTPSTLRLATGVVPIRGMYEVLYEIIRETVKIPNGDESELWFAIAYGGQVKGAVAGESGIEADIEVGGETISLKNYEKTTFDFGSLPTDGVQLLNGFLEMAKLLTGTDINKSKGRDQINSVLNFLDNEKTEADIRRIIQMGTETDIPMLQNIATKLQSFYQLDDNLDTMIHAFCKIVDKMVAHKIKSVGWWGMIIKSNKTLFLESSEELAPLLMCRNDRLSPAIANFHQNKLFVMGSQLNTKVTTKTTG
jgi:hypothetical protein